MASELSNQTDFLQLAQPIAGQLSQFGGGESSESKGIGIIGSAVSMAGAFALIPGGPIVGAAIGIIGGIMSDSSKRKAEEVRRRELLRQRVAAFRNIGKKVVKNLENYDKSLTKSQRGIKKLLSGTSLEERRHDFNQKVSQQISYISSFSPGVLNTSKSQKILKSSRLRYDAVIDGAYLAAQVSVARLGVAKRLVRQDKERIEGQVQKGKGDLRVRQSQAIDAIVGNL